MSQPLIPDLESFSVMNTEKGKMEMSIVLPEKVPLPTSSKPTGNRHAKYHLALPLQLYEASNKTKLASTAPTLQYASVSPQRPSLNTRSPQTALRPSSSGSSGPRSPAPSMSNSSKKIQQLMGFDIHPQFYGAEDNDQISLASSGSVYSTYEDGTLLSTQLQKERNRDDNAARSFCFPLEGSPGRTSRVEEVRKSEWSFSEDEQFCTRRLDEHSNRSSVLPYSKLSARNTDNPEDMATLNEILFDELQKDVKFPANSNYRRSLVDTRDVPMSPAVVVSPVSPLSPLSPKEKRKEKEKEKGKGKGKGKGRSKLRPVQVPKKPSYFANTHVRESYAWGMDDVTPTPTRKKHYNTPVTAIFSPSSCIGSPKYHPTSPLGLQRYGTETPSPPSPPKFHKRLSNTVKSWSTSPPKPKRRAPPSDTNRSYAPHSGNNHIDTPIPTRSTSFMNFSPTEPLAKGNEHFLDAVMKARAKVGLKTRDERRRDSLKKKIVVVGVADGSPDGKVSEWL